MEKSIKTIVISAINFNTAGPFAIFEECLCYLSQNLSNKYNIIALVHDRKQINFKNIHCIEFKDSKRSWLKRIYYEYFYFRKLSISLNPYLWFSFHDITPNVKSEIRAVYCMNPSPFYKLSLRDIINDKGFTLFVIFYKYLYRINIKKNDFVIVHHDWMRNKFKQLFHINRVIVAPVEIVKVKEIKSENKRETAEKVYRFIYPAFPRVFKNFEIICEAAKILAGKGKYNFEIYLTIDGTENRYASFIYTHYKNIKQIKFIGFQPREKIYEYYDKVDCLLFPSKLETYGMPISEFKLFKKPIFLADLEYAYETIGDYNQVKFFNPNNHLQLADLMSKLMEDRVELEIIRKKIIGPPFASTWKELFDILLSQKDQNYA